MAQTTSPSRLGSLPVILHCDKALFVVCGGGEYIYELVKRINKQKKNIPQGQSFEMFELFAKGLSNLAWSWWFETKSEVNVDMKLSTWSHDFGI